jgi:hypothetical protein
MYVMEVMIRCIKGIVHSIEANWSLWIVSSDACYGRKEKGGKAKGRGGEEE